MDSCRCKFKLFEIRENCYKTKVYVFTAEYDSKIPEDKGFAKATPNGRLEMTIDSVHAQAFFKLGETYYFDASAVPAMPQG